MAGAAKRIGRTALLACLVVWGGGCVVVNLGKPKVLSREKTTEIRPSWSTSEFLGYEAGVLQPRDAYANATVKLQKIVRETTFVATNVVVVDRITLTSQKRMAVGLFPGMGMHLFPTKGPEGASAVGPYTQPGQTYWRGITGWRYAAYTLLSPASHFFTVVFTPFMPWTVWGHYASMSSDLKGFSYDDLKSCGVTFELSPNNPVADGLQCGIVGVVKYPDFFIQREETSRTVLRAGTTTNVVHEALAGPFEVELRIPEVGFREKKTTEKSAAGRFRDHVDFALPTDPRAEDMVTFTYTNQWGRPDYDQRRRTYRALLIFHGLATNQYSPGRQDWAAVDGRTFEAEVRLEKGPSHRNTPVQAVEVVKEVHHYHETRVEVARPADSVREFEVEKSGDGTWRVRILSESLNALDADRKAKPQILESLRGEFADRHPGVPPGDVNAWAAYTTEDGGRTLVYVGAATALIPSLESLSYDATTRRGTVTMRLAEGTDPAKAKQFVRDHIAAIVCDKNVVLTAGERPPDGAGYRSLDENFAGGVLTADFEAVE